jgi:hypothetical protein
VSEPATAQRPSNRVLPHELPASLRDAGLANWIREPLDDAVDRRRRIIMPPAAATMGTPASANQGALLAEARHPDTVFMMGDNPALAVMPERPDLTCLPAVAGHRPRGRPAVRRGQHEQGAEVVGYLRLPDRGAVNERSAGSVTDRERTARRRDTAREYGRARRRGHRVRPRRWLGRVQGVPASESAGEHHEGARTGDSGSNQAVHDSVPSPTSNSAH